MNCLSKLAFVSVAIGLLIGCSIPSAQADSWDRYHRRLNREMQRQYWNSYYRPYPAYPYNPYYVSPYASPYPGFVVNPYPRRDGVSTAIRILRELGM